MLTKTLALGALISAVSFGAPISYVATLNGANESPANGSLGTGNAVVTIDSAAHTMQVVATFSGLTGTVTASHIHCSTLVPLTGTIGVATTTPTFTGFPSGVTSGFFSNLFDMTLASSYNPSFVTARVPATIAQAEADLFAGIAAGKTYVNIHTSFVGSGEIRGFLTATPEPGTFGLMAAAVLGLGLLRRKISA